MVPASKFVGKVFIYHRSRIIVKLSIYDLRNQEIEEHVYTILGAEDCVGDRHRIRWDAS